MVGSVAVLGRGAISRRLMGGLACFVLGCASGPPPRGHALYTHAQGPKQPSEVAQLAGPIVAVNGKNVTSLGDRFEVLPGCYIVEVQPPMQRNDHKMVFATNTEPIPFAVAARAGHSYVIRSEYIEQMGTLRLLLEGDEQDMNGSSVGKFGPAQSAGELQQCAARGNQ